MLDLMSTRETTTQETARCCRLLTAVIAQAIADATIEIVNNKRRKRVEHDIDPEANSMDSVWFLFSEGSVFPAHADAIGSSAESIRSALRQKRSRDLEWRIQLLKQNKWRNDWRPGDAPADLDV